jgi:hypothetical protein
MSHKFPYKIYRLLLILKGEINFHQHTIYESGGMIKKKEICRRQRFFVVIVHVRQSIKSQGTRNEKLLPITQSSVNYSMKIT